MEYHIKTIETKKKLIDLKRKLAALDGILQAELTSFCLHDTDDSTHKSKSKLKS